MSDNLTQYSQYDPRISTLVDSAESDWGSAERNRENMLRYRVGKEFDNALWGIPVGYESEIITIQGPIKNRKSTFLGNLVINFAFQMAQRPEEEQYWICIDSLESGMSPKSYRDMLISMIATRLIVAEHYGADRNSWPEAQQILMQDNLKPNLSLSRKFLRFGSKTETQLKYIEIAKTELKKLPISLFGPSRREGHARDLELSIDRWTQLYEGTFANLDGKKHRIFAIDHVQQYNGGAGSDYSNLERVTSGISDFAAMNIGSIMFPLSQVSLTSIRDAGSGNGKLRAKGGEKLAAESNLVIDVEYNREENPLIMKISANEGRDEIPPVMLQEIQPTSGVALRYAYPAVQRRRI